MSNPYTDPIDVRTARGLGTLTGNLDTAKVAGLIVIGAVLVLGGLRKSFASVRVSLGS